MGYLLLFFATIRRAVGYCHAVLLVFVISNNNHQLLMKCKMILNMTLVHQIPLSRQNFNLWAGLDIYGTQIYFLLLLFLGIF